MAIRSRRLIGFAIILVAVIAGVLLFSSHESGYELKFVLPSAAQLAEGSPVLINGNQVGHITKLAVQDGKATASNAASAPQASGDDLSAFFDRLRQKAQPGLDAADKEALVNIVMARTGQSRGEAEAVVANYQKTYDQAVAKYEELKVQAEQKAREVADATAKGVSRAAWAAVVVMLLGIAVSAVAGSFGFRSRVRHTAV